jgi:hypothetical protein
MTGILTVCVFIGYIIVYLMAEKAYIRDYVKEYGVYTYKEYTLEVFLCSLIMWWITFIE